MIEFFVTEMFERIGHLWRIGGTLRQPTENDVRQVLDEAAGVLYTSPTDTQFQTGGLIIEKADDGHDVYVYVGNYK